MSGTALDRVEETLIASVTDIRAGLAQRDRRETENPSGEQQLAADVAADRLLADRFGDIDGVGQYASEERENILDAGTGVSVAVDPLDGSSNLRSNNPMGTIVSVYDTDLPASGRDLLAAYYVLYGPLTTMVSVRAEEVTEQVLSNESVAETRAIRLPEEPTVYGFGGRVPDWPDAFAEFADEIEQELKLRYGGAMVADVNQVLTHGGIFAYPALTSAPSGKLRLQFEAIPIAAIVSAAGGAASDGQRAILDRSPEELHERVPVHVGNESLIERLEAALA